jgi:hypothetical protein
MTGGGKRPHYFHISRRLGLYVKSMFLRLCAASQKCVGVFPIQTRFRIFNSISQNAAIAAGSCSVPFDISWAFDAINFLKLLLLPYFFVFHYIRYILYVFNYNVRFQAGAMMGYFLFATASRPVLGFTQHPIQSVGRGCSFPRG